MIHLALPLALALCPAPTLGGLSYEVANSMVPSEPASRADRLAELLPADSFLVLRARSIQRVLDDANLLMGKSADAPDRLTTADLLEPLQSSGVAAKIALDRPVGLAMTFGAGDEPQLTAALPVLDAAGFLAALPVAGAEFHAVAAGDYVVVTTLPDFQLPGGANTLVAGLSAQDIVLHVDVAKFMAKFRPMIDMGMEMAETQLEQVESEPGQGDPALAAESYFDLARQFMDSAETLQLSLDTFAGRIQVGSRFTVKEGSSMSKWYSGERRDLSRLAALVDPDAALVVLSNADPAARSRGDLRWMPDLAEALPQKVRGLVELEQRVWEEMLPKLGGMSALCIDLSVDGMQGLSYIEAKEPLGLFASVQQFMAAPELAEFGLRVEGPVVRELDGTSWSEYRMQVDVETFAQAVDAELEIEASDKADAEHALEVFLGRGGLRLGLAAADGYLVLRMNGDDNFARRAIARLAAPGGSLGTGLDNSLAAARIAQAAYVGQIDIGRVLNQISDLAASLGHAPDLPVAALGRSFPLAFHGAVDGRTWRGGIELDALDLARFVKAMQEAEDVPPAPIEVDEESENDEH